MRRFVLASVLLLVACGDKQDINQSGNGDFSPNQIAGRDAVQNVNVQLSKEAEAALVQSLIAKGVPIADRAAELEELKRKYADLQQRLGEYAKTDELAQQARQALTAGQLDEAETLLQQAYDRDEQLSTQRLAQRAFDLAEVAELKLDHDKALLYYQKVTQYQPDNVTAWWRVAKIFQALGNSAQALHAWRGMQQAAQTQQQERELAAAIMGEADILKANGDSKVAQEKFLQAHEALKKAAEAEPDNTERQRDLSVSYERIGDLYQANGDTGAALKSYQDSLLIRKKLVELDPQQAEWQRDLSVSYNKVGDLYQAKGDTGAALKSYQDSLLIRKKLVALDPNQVEWQHDLSGSYGRLGDVYWANGDTNAALKSYQDSLLIRKKLVERDRNNVQWQTDVAVSYVKLSQVEPNKRKQYLQDALQILQRLDAENRLPKNQQAWIVTFQQALQQK